jgi:RNA polymerase sigma-70 factor (ECF subfamily)
MRKEAELSEADLYQRAMGGEEAAFAAMYRRHQGPLYRFALRMSGSEAVAEEVTQEVFLALLREPGRFRPERGGLGAFLLGVARHLVLRRLERRPRLVALEEQEPAERTEGPAGEFERRSEIEAVRRAVAGLPVRYREVVVLCELGEAGYEEAARAIGCPVGTVRSRLNRARALLRAKLAAARGRARCVA